MNIDEVVYNTHKDMNLNRINDKLYLTNYQIKILNKYKIEYKNKSIEELLYELDDILNYSNDYEDLDKVANDLAEFNYYHNTKK